MCIPGRGYGHAGSDRVGIITQVYLLSPRPVDELPHHVVLLREALAELHRVFYCQQSEAQ